MVCCWEIREYCSSCWVCCFCSSSYTFLYASVIFFVNSARVEDLVALSYSSTVNLASIAVLLLSMHSSSSVTSLRIPDTSILVVDAAFLSALIMSLFSPIAWCISPQYLPYEEIVCVFRSMACASSIYYRCSWMQLPYICYSNSLIVMLPFFSWSFRNAASFIYCLSYLPTWLCRCASSASKADVDGYWKEKSSSSILTAVGRVVSRCSKELSDCEMAVISCS
jgi:hypothetical protein